MLADVLRRCVLDDVSISAVARETGVPQATLQEFAVGKRDGTFADLRLSSAQLLIDHYGLASTIKSAKPLPRGRKRMLLKNELAACNCTDSPEKFRERLIDAIQAHCPGMTIDGIVCDPKMALSYFGYVQEMIGSESLHEAVVLKTLMNIRKQKSCPTGLRSTGKRRNLKRELEKAECRIEPARFKEIACDCHADMYKSRTIDEIVCHPREAMALCNYVRMKADCSYLSDDLILSTMMNVRKAAGAA